MEERVVGQETLALMRDARARGYLEMDRRAIAASVFHDSWYMAQRLRDSGVNMGEETLGESMSRILSNCIENNSALGDRIGGPREAGSWQLSRTCYDDTIQRSWRWIDQDIMFSGFPEIRAIMTDDLVPRTRR